MTQRRKHFNPFLHLAGIVLLRVAMISLLLSTCTQPAEKEQLLLGSWKAQWKTTVNNMPEIPVENLTMDGRITFHKNGTVYIEAFGHARCIFTQDTLQNLLRWELEDTTIRFVDQGDESGLPYTIDQLTSDSVELVLMDDIFLTLSR